MNWSLGNATWVELLYSGMAFIGLMASILGASECWKDLRAVKSSKLNGARLLFAKKTVRGETIKGIVQALLLMLGTYLAFQPPANDNHPVTTNGIILGSVLFTIEVLLMANSLFDRYDRKRLVRYMSALTYSAPFMRKDN